MAKPLVGGKFSRQTSMTSLPELEPAPTVTELQFDNELIKTKGSFGSK